MTVITSHKDLENLTLTFSADFPATAERVWQVWEDPRQLERWWGPPTWPATFVRHEFRPGGRSSYYMTGPDGDKAGGWWEIVDVDAPNTFSFDDGFADENGEPTGDIAPTRTVVTLSETDGVTRMTSVTQFISLEQLEQMVQMGMEEGLKLAMGQIDGLLAEDSRQNA